MIIRQIPNAITCLNLISGCVATVFALSGNAPIALLWIISGAVFDFFDGMTARLLRVSSPIGKELDSLADDVTFGVAPASIVFAELGVIDYPFLESWRDILPFFAYLMAAFSALRLAKFNLDKRQGTSFVGLPTPANALFWGSLIAGAPKLIESTPWSMLAMLVLICLSCWIMVAEIPMFALKFKQWNWRGNEVRYGFVIFSAIMIILLRVASFAVIIPCYVILSVILNKRVHVNTQKTLKK